MKKFNTNVTKNLRTDRVGRAVYAWESFDAAMRRGAAVAIRLYGGADIGTMASVNKQLFMSVVKMEYIPYYNATENVFLIEHVLYFTDKMRASGL